MPIIQKVPAGSAKERPQNGCTGKRHSSNTAGHFRIIDNVLIYSRFDELPEELVDILAYDLRALLGTTTITHWKQNGI